LRRVAHGVDNVLEGLHQRTGRLEQRVLERAHALEHVGGAVGDHVAREKDTRVDSLGRQRSGERAVTKGGREVHALQARLAQLDDLLLAQEDDQVLEAATGTQSGFSQGMLRPDPHAFKHLMDLTRSTVGPCSWNVCRRW